MDSAYPPGRKTTWVPLTHYTTSLGDPVLGLLCANCNLPIAEWDKPCKLVPARTFPSRPEKQA